MVFLNLFLEASVLNPAVWTPLNAVCACMVPDRTVYPDELGREPPTDLALVLTVSLFK